MSIILSDITAECVVVAISDSVCEKYYEQDVLTVYDRALEAYKAGIAPEVYDVNYRTNSYQTERVQILGDLPMCQHCHKYGECCDVCDEALVAIGFDCSTLLILEQDARNIFNITNVDLHPDNVGIKDNKLVLIDFGKASISE